MEVEQSRAQSIIELWEEAKKHALESDEDALSLLADAVALIAVDGELPLDDVVARISDSYKMFDATQEAALTGTRKVQ